MQNLRGQFTADSCDLDVVVNFVFYHTRNIISAMMKVIQPNYQCKLV